MSSRPVRRRLSAVSREVERPSQACRRIETASTSGHTRVAVCGVEACSLHNREAAPLSSVFALHLIKGLRSSLPWFCFAFFDSSVIRLPSIVGTSVKQQTWPKGASSFSPGAVGHLHIRFLASASFSSDETGSTNTFHPLSTLSTPAVALREHPLSPPLRRQQDGRADELRLRRRGEPFPGVCDMQVSTAVL